MPSPIFLFIWVPAFQAQGLDRLWANDVSGLYSSCIGLQQDSSEKHGQVRDTASSAQAGFGVPPLLADVHGAPILSIGRRDTGIGFHRPGSFQQGSVDSGWPLLRLLEFLVEN